MRKNLTWRNWRGSRERARRILRMRAEKLSWAEIGRQLGLSRQRAHQLGREIAAGEGPYAGLERRGK